MWHVRANGVVLAYLCASVVALVLGSPLPVPRWLAVHLLLLGAVTNAIVTWSEHFTVALLRAPAPGRRRSAVRLVALNIAVLGILAGVAADVAGVTVGAAGLLGVVVVAHTASLVRLGRAALQGRFARTARFYVAAGVWLLVGITVGTLLALGTGGWRWHERLHAAHVHANLLGWVGLTVLGTLFTLWPTVLRTRIAEGAMTAARWCLLLACAGLALTVAGLLVGRSAVTAGGLVLYAGGVGVALGPFVTTWRRKRPSDAPAWFLAASTVWLLVSVVADLAFVMTTRTDGAYLGLLDALVPLILVGFVAQVLVGALTYLLPVVLGGGPHAVRGAAARLGLGWPWRLASVQVALAVLALPAPHVVDRLAWLTVAANAGVFVVLAASLLVRRPDTAVSPAAPPAPAAGTGTEPASTLAASTPAAATAATAAGLRHAGRRAALGGVLLSLLLTAVPVLIAVSGGSQPSGPGVYRGSAGDQVIAVTLENMDIRPGVVEVPPGTHVRLVVTNRDAMRHDLAFDDGPSIGLLSRGERARLDLGVVTSDRHGKCTVPGHAAAGMRMWIRVSGPAADSPAATGMDSMAMGSGATSSSASAAPLQDLDVHGRPGADFRPYDARLNPAQAATLHRVTLRVTEQEMEVAPGVRQRMWTFNGTAPGPVLRGRVGDVFVVTLVNDGTMEHGVDFHAGSVAPDVAMRMLTPGKSLTYRFRATAAGAWLYHCSAMPMSQHVANGMYGAVIIDPPGLAHADREYVLISSELYLGPQGGVADPAKLRADAWDAALFNGYPDQYVHAPLKARAGERVRFWTVAAGPSEGLDFHVIGAVFDTVYREGAYVLRRGDAGSGGAQVLDLAPGQGGFVETVFPEAGSYPVVDHDMRRGENGARGIVEVTARGSD